MQSSVDLLKKLKEQHDKHTVSVLVGAGFSKNAIKSYPGWDELLRELIVDLYGKQIQERYKRHQSGLGPFLSEEDFTDIEIADIIREVGYLKLVSKYIEDKGYREAIDVYIEDHLPYVEETGGVFKVTNAPTVSFNVSNLNVHKDLLLCKWKHVYTTNYDNLLELTNDLYGMDYEKVTVDYKLSELSEHRGIVKIHGSLVGDSLSNDFEFDNDKSRRYIISAEDYATYADKHQAFSYQMKTGLLTGVFCLIGFSGNDPNFLAWLEWMKDVLDRDKTGSKEDPIKVFLITIGKQQIEKSRQLFYQNHHIGIINLLDSDVLKLIGANPLAPDVKTAFTFMFRYLNDGTAVVINPNGKIITNTLSQYQRIWSSIDTNNVTVGDVNEVRRLRKSIVMPPTANRQRIAIDRLFNKKEWTKQDAELFAIACLDCGIWYVNFRNDEKTALINDVMEWQLLRQMGSVLHNEEIDLLADNTDWNTYLKIARYSYRFELKSIKENAENWNAEIEWLLNKAASLVFAEVAKCRFIIDEFLNTSQDIERRYYASVLGNIVSDQLPPKYSYNEYWAAGINGFVECRDAIIKTIRDCNKEEIKPYGSSGWSFVMTKREADVEEAFRFMELLFMTGFPIQYKGRSLISHQDWYEIFRRIFVYMPYPALYYSLQLTDQKILKRIGQDYAYLEPLASITPDLLKKVLRVIVEDVGVVNWNSCLLVAKELMCSVDESEWFDLMVAIFNKEVVPNATVLSRREAVYQFLEDAAVYLKDVKKKSSFLELLLEHFEDNTYFYSEIICSLLKSNDIELTQKQIELVAGIVDRQPISKTYMLLAQLDYCNMLNKGIKKQIVKRIKEYPEDVEKASFEVLFSLTFISYGDEVVVGIIKRSILSKDIWCCGIVDRSASVPQYLALNKISKDIKWTPDEMMMIMDNLQKNLQLLEGWNLYADGFLTREHIGILSDMKEFTEYNCIEEAGLIEYESVLKHINDVMIKSFGSSNVLEKVFDKEVEIGDELNVLARAIGIYGLDKYKVYVNAVIDRALLQCTQSLTLVLAFVEYLVDKHKEVLDDKSVVYRLNLMLDKYIEVNYQQLNLSLAVAYRSMHKVAEVLNDKNLINDQSKSYWLENEFVGRFVD